MQSYVRHALLWWDGDCSALFTSTHLDHNQFYQYRVIIYFELSSKSDWGHSQLRLVYSTCLYSHHCFVKVTVPLLISHAVWLCQHTDQNDRMCRHKSLVCWTLTDWVWARGNQMQVMLFNQVGVLPYVSWSLCPAKTSCRMTSMLSSAADLTWLLQDITESYCMNSQEARQKLTVQNKGIVDPKMNICWNVLALRQSKM